MELTCDACDVSEDMYRALLTAHWDPKEQRASSSLFQGFNISVSRKKLMNLYDTACIFRLELHNPPKNCLLGVGELNVGAIEKVVEVYNGEFKQNFEVIVVPRPTKNNPAHAEINPEECDVRKITKGLSKRMIREMTPHPLDIESDLTQPAQLLLWSKSIIQNIRAFFCRIFDCLFKKIG